MDKKTREDFKKDLRNLSDQTLMILNDLCAEDIRVVCEEILEEDYED